MDLLSLLLIVIIGAGLIYWLPETKKVVFFIWAVCALVWFLTVFGVMPARVHLR